jgi:hypothetical protein
VVTQKIEAESFTDYLLGRVLPRWMQGPLGVSFPGVVIGLVADAAAESLAVALRAPWLHDPKSPDDALPRLGRERRMPRYADESPEQYRARLLEAPAVYRAAGDEGTILSQIAKAGWPGAQIWDPRNMPSAFADPSYYSQFVVNFPTGTHPVTALGPAWGSFSYGDGTRWGPVGITFQQIQTIRGIIKKWKPSLWICAGINFQLSGTFPTGVGSRINP